MIFSALLPEPEARIASRIASNKLSPASYKLGSFFGSDFKKENKHESLCLVKKL
jgi:hypothetical protein